MKLLKKIYQSKIFYILLTLFTFLSFYLIANSLKKESIYNPKQTSFTGEIIKIKKTDYGYSLILKNKENLVVYLDEYLYNLGDQVKIEGTLEIPSNNTIPNNFNYKKYLNNQQIYYILKAKKITLLKENTNIFIKLKQVILTYLNKFKSKNYLQAFILGDTSSLNNIYDSYQKNGISHLLSIGSTHITLLNYLIIIFLKKIKLKKIAEPVSYLLVFLFLILLDFPISMLRLFLYLVITYLFKKFNLKVNSLLKYYLVIIITLLINPFYIFNKGFLYSYFISFILILNKDKLTGNYLFTIFKISLLSFLGSIPLNIYFNYEINLFSIFYNLLYVPIFNLIIFPLSLLTLIFPFLDNLFYFVMEILNNISLLLNNFNQGIIILKKIDIFILGIYILIIIYIINTILNKKIHGLVILSIILVIHININKFIKDNYVITIDVKQGDSSLLYLDDKAILIDTGGLYNQIVVEKTIVMLKSFGINKIDYLIITHGDYDHMGDSIYLVNNFKVDKVILNNDDYNELEKKLIKVLDKKKIKYLKGLQEIKLDNYKLEFLNTSEYDNENDNSNVIYLNYNDYKFLFMGDAGIDREKDILKKYVLKDIDFLKVGHHGSNTSSSKIFINNIKPKYAIISVGKNNRYGHPKSSVLDTLSNSKIYRTDLDGSILIRFNKNGYKIRTCNP